MKNQETIKKDMEEEFADIILVCFLAGKRLGINIEEALKKKIEKVKGRNY